ncbi:hypothetical protein AVEN_270847-1 [Araneus ventricosus]|uniref:Glucose-methanol-choline oxidoreductase C-terminal domain-containing protein n=1 Tax=Araneus ventricosus TaxID=182803 RepID=A0A4Y2V6N9_ARAVE|nr:hypothetical protein AVEN_270847-1 [Araneus ventricosus]
MNPVLLRPKSKGYIKLRSTDPYDPPIIDPKYLTHPQDILTMVDSMKICLSAIDTPAIQKVGGKLFESPLPGCDHFPRHTDAFLECLARTYTATLYHPVGTCKMGHPLDPTTVVDPHLRFASRFFQNASTVLGSCAASDQNEIRKDRIHPVSQNMNSVKGVYGLGSLLEYVCATRNQSTKRPCSHDCDPILDDGPRPRPDEVSWIMDLDVQPVVRVMVGEGCSQSEPSQPRGTVGGPISH